MFKLKGEHKKYGGYSLIKVKLGGKPAITINALEYVSVSPIKLSVELVEHPGKYSWISSLVNATKAELDEHEARLVEEMLENYDAKKPMTKWMLEGVLKQSKKYRRLTTQLSDLQSLLESLKERGRILQNQSSLIKDERYQTRG